MTYLKPCPFCGGESHFQAQQGDNPEPFAWDVVHHCAAGGFIRMDPRDSKYRSTKAEAAAAWNTRAERDVVLEQAAQAVEEAGYYCIPPYDETGSLPEQIDYSAAAIRAMKGGEQ